METDGVAVNKKAIFAEENPTLTHIDPSLTTHDRS